VTVTVMVALPLASASGVMSMVRVGPEPPSTMFGLPSGIRLWSSLVAVTVSADAAVSTSSMVKLSAPVLVSSSMVWSGMSLIVGASLTAVTLTTNVSVAIKPPLSLTVSVIVAGPFASATGVTVIVRSPPEMVFSARPLWATTLVLLLEAVTAREPSSSSPSLTVKASAPVSVSSSMT